MAVSHPPPGAKAVRRSRCWVCSELAEWNYNTNRYHHCDVTWGRVREPWHPQGYAAQGLGVIYMDHDLETRLLPDKSL